MSIIGVRRLGSSRIVLMHSLDALRVGERVTVEADDEVYAATVAIAADQLPDSLPAMPISGNASRIEVTRHERSGQSHEDERYRQRKHGFPALGDRRPDGIVVRIDMRHESFDVRDERGVIIPIVLPSCMDSQP